VKSVCFHGLSRPLGVYRDILDYCLRPAEEPKAVDLCCGLGFGKTLLAIQLAVQTMNVCKDQRLLFLEPDWDRINDIFIPKWERYVPEELYHHNVGKGRMEWYNGAQLIYRPRVITGSVSRRREKFKGIEFTSVIDDETAIGFDLDQYVNTFARIRSDVKIPARYYLTSTTPIIGPYGRFLKRGGNKIFTGKTRDNFYLHLHDPGYEARQRRNMSPDQARRELDGELVALEGRIWKTAVYDKTDKAAAWPNGNRNDQHTQFDKDKPWWLFCDIGSATGAFVVMQQTDAEIHGREVFRDPVWVAIADLCPHQDASASRAFQRLKDEYGVPVAVVGGADIETRSSTDGRTVAYFVRQTWGAHVSILPCNERKFHKQVQYNRLDFLFCSSNNERRFTIARYFKSLDSQSHRGVVEMIQEDAWPSEDKRRVGDILPKGKDNMVQHVRDALLMGAAMVMSPPNWLYDDNPAA